HPLFSAPPCSPLFPYTTLFRSSVLVAGSVTSSVDDVGSGFVCPSPVWLVGSVSGGGPCAASKGCGMLRDASEASTVASATRADRSEEHTSELQSRENLVCRLLL